MSVPYTPPPPTVTYIVRINSEEPNEYKTPANASKYVAENIFVGHWAAVEFKNAADIKQVRENFNARMENLVPAGGAYRRVLVSAHPDWCELSAKGIKHLPLSAFRTAWRSHFSVIVSATGGEMFLRSRAASIGATVYWLMFVCASVYPEFDNRPSAVIPAFVLAWPWVVFLPSTAPSLLVTACALLNTALTYVFIATVSFLRGRFRRKGEPLT